MIYLMVPFPVILSDP